MSSLPRVTFPWSAETQSVTVQLQKLDYADSMDLGPKTAQDRRTEDTNYLYSIFAFHWVSDVDASVKEVSRVLKPSGEMDLFFIGRDNTRGYTEIYPDFLEVHRTCPSSNFSKDAQTTTERCGI